jgi:hypothetical protein
MCWLLADGWSRDDVFIDLHGIGAEERWRETLVKANVSCEALLYLASPHSLESEECKREVRRVEDDRKEIIVAILDVKSDDPRLAPYANRQMDLSIEPREEAQRGRALGAEGSHRLQPASTGDFETANVTVGEFVGLDHDLARAGEVIDRVVAEASALFRKFAPVEVAV